MQPLKQPKYLVLLFVLSVPKLQGQPTPAEMQASQTENRFFSLDLIFLLDGSTSVGNLNFEKVKAFVKQIAAEFNISDGSTQIGVIQYSFYNRNNSLDNQMHLTTEIALGEVTDPDVFENSLNDVKLLGLSTYTSFALNKTVLDFQASRRYSDPSTAQVVVLFTDGNANDGQYLPATAAYVRSLGVKVIAVGVGLTNKEELRIIATGTDTDEGVYSVNGFSDLDNIVQDVREAIDVNECDNSTVRSSCPSNATCFNTVGSYICQCNDGFRGNETCNDIDECEENTDNCHPNATCMNLIGSHTCQCKVGFNGTGFICTDNNECEVANNDCDDNATCTNVAGSFFCRCDSGFSGDGVACGDINECEDLSTIDCSPDALCENTKGSYFCECKNGFSGNGFRCDDIDECANPEQNNCHADALCTNTRGSHGCNCNAGFTGDGLTCTDIDECDGENNCHSDATCSNTPGSFKCMCNPGYTGDGVECIVTVNVTCLDSSITVTIVAKYLTEQGIALRDLHFRNTSCTGVVHEQLASFWVYETGLSDCLTEVNSTETSLVYSNTLSNIRESGAFFGVPHTIAIKCAYSTRVNMEEERLNHSNSNNLVALQPPTSLGEFDAKFELFTDAAYTVEDARTEYSPNDIIFVQISLDSSVEDLALQINSCWATPDPNGALRYTFIEDGCPVAGANENIKVFRNGEETRARFQTPIIGFVNSDSVYLQCSLEACLTSIENTCAISCNSRRKRSLQSITRRRNKRQILIGHILKTKLISVGPFVMKKDHLKTAEAENIEVDTATGLSNDGLIGLSVACAFIALISVVFAAYLIIRQRESVGPSREYIAFEHIGELDN